MRNDNKSDIKKVVIIGSGPAGLAAAIYAGRGLLDPLVIEGPIPGGQPTQTSEVENYPGFSVGMQGNDIASNMRLQAQKFGTTFLSGYVRKIEKKDNLITITLDNGTTVLAEAIIVTTGANANWLGLESETRLRGLGVSACATCDGFFFRDKKVAVIGGGDSAMEEALFLTKYASRVYVIHRRDSFRASKIMQEKVFGNDKIEIKHNREIVEFIGEKILQKIKLKDTTSGVEEELPVDGAFLAIGHTPSTEFLAGSGVMLDKKGYILTSERVSFDGMTDVKDSFSPHYRYQTNIEGIFAAGDCMDYVYRQIGTAVGMGIAAEIEVEKYLETKKN